MATDEVAGYIASLGSPTNLRLFEILSSGAVCGCGIAERLGVSEPDAEAVIRSMMESGLVECGETDGIRRYSLNEEAVCMLNRYFNDAIYRCRSNGLQCRCGSGGR